MNVSERIEAGLALSKLVSKLECRGLILEKKNEIRVSTTSIDTRIQNVKRASTTLSKKGVKQNGTESLQ